MRPYLTFRPGAPDHLQPSFCEAAMKPFSEAVFAKEGSLSDTKVPVLPMFLAATKIFTQIRSEMIANMAGHLTVVQLTPAHQPTCRICEQSQRPLGMWQQKPRKRLQAITGPKGFPLPKGIAEHSRRKWQLKKEKKTVKPKPYISRSFKKQIQLQRLALASLAIKVPSFQHMSSKITILDGKTHYQWSFSIAMLPLPEGKVP